MHSFVRSLIEKKKIHEAETGNLPGVRTHILNKDVRDPDHGIIPNSTVLRHTGDDKYEVRAGRAKGKIISIDKQHVNKLDEGTTEKAPSKDSNAPKMVQDRKTGEMYDPQKKFRELMNKPETKATMKRLAKEEAEQVDEKSKGLWANIHAKRKRGERPAKPGEEGYPKTLNIESVESIDEISADTARSYLDKSKAEKPDLAKAAKRFGGSMRAHGVIHRDELKKMSARLAQQRKDLGLTKESAERCGVCSEKPCSCTKPIIKEMNRDTLHSYMTKANARIEDGHRELHSQIKSGNAGAANKTAATIQKRMTGTERAEKKLGESTRMKSLTQIIAEAEQKSVHPDGIHVKPVKVNGQQKYHVHAVGKNFQSGIKVGEHLSDTELDDFSEMGGRIKHVK